ncbi:MAG: hypothetical protein JWP85_2141 [Rhodoglobus sp.]|nr:hypothetical protein [Rhodoglobus sp.]
MQWLVVTTDENNTVEADDLAAAAQAAAEWAGPHGYDILSVSLIEEETADPLESGITKLIERAGLTEEEARAIAGLPT